MTLIDNFFVYLSKQIILLTFFIWIIIINSILIGNILIYLKFSWSIIAYAILLISLIILLKIKNIILKHTISFKKHIYIIPIFIIIFILYALNYSPILEIRQDPSVYLFKALNLIHYGTLYHPMNYLDELINLKVLNSQDYVGYAKILNGTSYFDGKLNVDFFQSPSLIYAFFGKISMKLFFITPFFINFSSAMILYLIFLKYTNTIVAAISSVLFFISPSILWFGRAPFSEPVALLAILSFIYINESINDSKRKYIILAIITIFAYMSRIDLLILLLLYIFYVSYKESKIGFFILILSILLVYINATNSYIYFNRIANASILFKYSYFALILSYISGRFFAKYISIEDLISFKWFQYLLFSIFIFIILFMFRDNLPLHCEMIFQHGRLMRTYNETNMEKLFLIMPSFVIIIGFLYIPLIIKNKLFKLSTVIVILPLFIVFLYYIYNISNSPQLYWSIRRYEYVILPIIYISFILFLAKQNIQTTKILLFLLTVSIINLSLNAKIRPEMKNLDFSVKQFIQKYPEQNIDLILYDSTLKYILSPILSYGKYDFLPISDMTLIPKIQNIYKGKHIIYISRNLIPNMNAKIFTIKYTRTGENYYRLPKDLQYHNNNLYVMDKLNNELLIKDIKTNILRSDANFSGLYNDKVWTNGNLKITNISLSYDNMKYLKVSLFGYKKPYAPKELNITIHLNKKVLTLSYFKKDIYYFKLQKNKDIIKSLQVESKVFQPSFMGYNHDKRKLGLDLQSLVLTKDINENE